MTGRFPPDVGLRVGQALPVSLAMNRFHLFDPDTGVAMRGARLVVADRRSEEEP